MHSHLPPATLPALRLVCRAARDELVDGRCTALKMRLRPQNSTASAVPATQALCGLAGRLPCLESLSVGGGGSGEDMGWGPPLLLEDCDELAAALERLPNPAALTALDLGCVGIAFDRQGRDCAFQRARASLRHLAAAVCRCQALRALRFEINNTPLDASHECLKALLVSAASRLPALIELSAAYSDHDFGVTASEQMSDWAERLPLQQLRVLELKEQMTDALLPVLLRLDVAPALTALRALTLDPRGVAQVLSALWRAPWVPQLTRLELKGLDASDDAVDALFAALPHNGAFAGAPPPLLRSIKELTVAASEVCVEEHHQGLVEDLRRLLAAANPATLEALALEDCQQGAAAALAERAGAFTALKRLRLDGRDFCRSVGDDGQVQLDCNRPAAAWRAIQAARFARLDSLDIGCAGWLLHAPERLGALLSAPWAASLMELSLWGSDQPLQAGAFTALSALPQLQRLQLNRIGLDAEELGDAFARGLTAGLAARLTDLRILAPSLEAGVLAALGLVPFERLERLAFKAFNHVLLLSELHALSTTGAPWLARLSKLELAASYRTRQAVWAASLDPSGPLRALHRGGGEVVWYPSCSYLIPHIV